MWFKEIKKEDVPSVGGKGANLGEMYSNFPIPNGFCITVAAYQEFLKENNIQELILSKLEKLDIDNSEALEKASKEIKEIVMKAKTNKNLKKEIIKAYNILREKFIAVRSSATAEDLPNFSFAGQQATYLNVKGNKDLFNSVKKCWASLFTPRAIYYRTINKFEHSKVFISVVIQEMVNSKKAGVMFSVNPVNNNREELIIEGSFGLGEMVVSGQVTPDNYIVTKKNLKIKNCNVNEKNKAMIKNKKGKNEIIDLDFTKANEQCLSTTEIIELSKIGINIENYYKFACDIEWAINEQGEMKILQSRAITTLK